METAFRGSHGYYEELQWLATCDQIRWVIHAPRCTRNQMVYVRFTFGAELTALLTTSVVTSENNGPHLVPVLCTRTGA